MRVTDTIDEPTSAVRFLILGSILLMAFSFGCGSGNGTQAPSGPSSDTPELTDEIIHERINETRVWEVPEENGNGKEIVWNFDEDEPKEITIVEKQLNGTKATMVLDIKTRSAPRAREPRHLAGQIRLEWELRTGWVLRRWEIVDVENVSMKYKNTPKPPEQNSNRGPEQGNQGNTKSDR